MKSKHGDYWLGKNLNYDFDGVDTNTVLTIEVIVDAEHSPDIQTDAGGGHQTANDHECDKRAIYRLLGMIKQFLLVILDGGKSIKNLVCYFPNYCAYIEEESKPAHNFRSFDYYKGIVLSSVWVGRTRSLFFREMRICYKNDWNECRELGNLLVTMDTVLCIKLLVFLFTRCSWVSFEICGNPLFRLFFQMQLFFTRTGNGVLYLTAQPPLNKLQKAYSYININLVRLPVPRKEKKKKPWLRWVIGLTFKEMTLKLHRPLVWHLYSSRTLQTRHYLSWLG